MPDAWHFDAAPTGARARRGGGGHRGTGSGLGAGLLDAGALRHLGSAARRGAGAGRAPARLLGRQHRDHALDARHVTHDLFGCLAQRLELGGALRRHGDGERHPSVLQKDFRYQPEVDDVVLHVGPLDPAQAVDDLVLVHAHPVSLEVSCGALASSLRRPGHRRMLSTHTGRRAVACHGKAGARRPSARRRKASKRTLSRSAHQPGSPIRAFSCAAGSSCSCRRCCRPAAATDTGRRGTP